MCFNSLLCEGWQQIQPSMLFLRMNYLSPLISQEKKRKMEMCSPHHLQSPFKQSSFSSVLLKLLQNKPKELTTPTTRCFLTVFTCPARGECCQVTQGFGQKAQGILLWIWVQPWQCMVLGERMRPKNTCTNS